MKTRNKFFALIVALGWAVVAQAISVSGANVVPGVWNSSYAKAKAYADSTHTPLLLFWASTGCPYCETLEGFVDRETFKTWQAERQIVMSFVMDNETVKYVAKGGLGYDGKNDSTVTAWNYLTKAKRTAAITQFPFIYFYWNREDGKVFEFNFPGRPDKGAERYMPSREGGSKDREVQLAASIDLLLDYCGGWDPNRGSSFGLSDVAGSRLEFVPGMTQTVRVPLTRSSTEAATETVMAGAQKISVVWAKGEKEKEITVDVANATADVMLVLSNAKGIEQAKQTIHKVSAPANSVRNPASFGDLVNYGEWTLDYAAAKAKVAQEGGDILAVISGVLWCPYCKGAEDSLLSSREFKTWAAQNKVIPVLFDQGRASDPATAAGTNAPRLVTLIEDKDSDGKVASGAAYVSRHGVTAAQATAYINQVTKYTAAWLAPGATAKRLGNPTFLLVRNDKVVARLNPMRDEKKVYDPAENVARLTELFAAAGIDETEAALATSKLTLAVGESKEGEFQVNASKKYYKLTGLTTTGRLQVTSDKAATVTLFQNGTQVASGKGEAAFNVMAAGDLSKTYYVLVEFYADAATKKYAAAGSTVVSSTVSSALVPIPGEIGFDQKSFSLLKQNGSAKISLTRKNGSSGAVTVKVVRSGGTAQPGVRYDWKDQTFSWKNGETGTKSFTFAVKPEVPFMADQTVQLQIQKVEGDIDLTTSSLVITLTDTTKPTLSRQTYDLTMFTGFTPTFAEEAYNIGSRVTARKVSGMLPTGLSFAVKDGVAAFAKAPTKVGTYKVAYSLVSNGETGSPITFNITVKDPKTLNPKLGTAFASTLPVFDGAAMVGQINVSMTARNKLSVRYSSTASRVDTLFTGLWDSLSADGTASATLTKKNQTIALTLSKNGKLSASIQDPGFKNTLAVLEASIGGGFSDCAGIYTVSYVDQRAARGAGYILVKMKTLTAIKSGKAKCTIFFPDGKTATVTATMASYDDDFVCLTIFKRTINNLIAAPLLIRRKATSAASHRAVIAMDGMKVRLTHQETNNNYTSDCDVFGSYFDPSHSLVSCCDSTTLTFRATGALGDNTTVNVSDTKLAFAEKTMGLSISYTKLSGTFTGRTRLTIAPGRTVIARFAGVILPDWASCGCGDEAESDLIQPETGMPFAYGSLYYLDGMVKKSILVRLEL